MTWVCDWQRESEEEVSQLVLDLRETAKLARYLDETLHHAKEAILEGVVVGDEKAAPVSSKDGAMAKEGAMASSEDGTMVDETVGALVDTKDGALADTRSTSGSLFEDKALTDIKSGNQVLAAPCPQSACCLLLKQAMQLSPAFELHLLTGSYVLLCFVYTVALRRCAVQLICALEHFFVLFSSSSTSLCYSCLVSAGRLSVYID